MFVAWVSKQQSAPGERHSMTLLRSFQKRHGTDDYKHFAPIGAETESRPDLGTYGAGPLFSYGIAGAPIAAHSSFAGP
jgi:hypothetical protein